MALLQARSIFSRAISHYKKGFIKSMLVELPNNEWIAVYYGSGCFYQTEPILTYRAGQNKIGEVGTREQLCI